MKRIRIKKEHLFIDRFQGRNEKNRSFGFIGIQIKDYKPQCYCGMFFTYPGKPAKVMNESEIELMVATLEYDATTDRPEVTHVPLGLAQDLLRSQCKHMLIEHKRSLAEGE